MNWEIYYGMNIFFCTFHIVKVVALPQKRLRFSADLRDGLRDGLLSIIFN